MFGTPTPRRGSFQSVCGFTILEFLLLGYSKESPTEEEVLRKVLVCDGSTTTRVFRKCFTGHETGRRRD